MTTTLVKNIAVEVDGDGQAVVCIHGLGGSSNNWTPVLSAFEGMKVVRPDLPGSARSALPSQPLSIDLYVETLAAVLRELDISKAHMVAHSMGTIIAQHLAIKHPELVKSLALFGPLLAPPEQGRPGIQARAALSREKGVAGVQEIADAIVKGATSAETKAQRPVAIALVRESVMRQSPEGYAQSCEALAGAQATEVEKIGVPTLLVTGDEDGVGQPAAVKAMGERIAGSNVMVLSGCGHWTTFEKPVECAEALKAFYKSTQ
ncbi:3-oxoadipate enol-lactonase 2 (plasmid) [Caballeronia sp. SBC1]|uniref:alpha/beta fold hydrolase n=1 Tax=unclassified Caballeronia TaxID=2646786 RepID=UPI0013E121A2|nr:MULTISPECIES: alpha/beta fold hydrolase [unclassified Caballeronia]QIE26491.1 3-oxoadipate enol-lactonase 2 [Caballeronia sp. SBC2]QIN64192.1 3-oxoadipate enol-lactonase 2 [Caballeronia sp. SBC1]